MNKRKEESNPAETQSHNYRYNEMCQHIIKIEKIPEEISI